MNTLTRRTFGKRILAATALPLMKSPAYEPQSPESGAKVPDVIAGYTLTPEDRQLAARFLATHEKNLSALRENDLPNGLAPNFIFASPKVDDNRTSF